MSHTYVSVSLVPENDLAVDYYDSAFNSILPNVLQTWRLMSVSVALSGNEAEPSPLPVSSSWSTSRFTLCFAVFALALVLGMGARALCMT